MDTRGPDTRRVFRLLRGISGRSINVILACAGGDEFANGEVHACGFAARTLQIRRMLVGEAKFLITEYEQARDPDIQGRP